MRRVGPILYSDADCIGAHIAMASQSSRAYIRFYSAAFCRKLYTGADKLLTLSGMRVKGWPLQTIHQPFTNHSPTIHQPFTNHSPTIHQLFTNPSLNFSRPACIGTSCRLRNTPSILVQNGITEIFAHDFGARTGVLLLKNFVLIIGCCLCKFIQVPFYNPPYLLPRELSNTRPCRGQYVL